MDQRQEAFPAPSRLATGLVNGVETEVSSVSFSDKIMVTISQDGRLAQWVRRCSYLYLLS
jgi:proteasome assembly chaperone 3